MTARPTFAGLLIGTALSAGIHPYCRLLAAIGRHYGIAP